MEPSEYKPFSPQVHEYVDGRLSTEDEQAFEARLARNPELKQQVEALQKSIELLHAVPITEPKAGFTERVIGRIREEELATRARKQISAAPTPLWQNIVQVGLGAAAAALVLAVIGVPGMFSDETDPLSGTGEGGSVARVSPTEEDLLPALADQSQRFDSMRRNVAHTKLADANLQRQVVAMELQSSDLMRRNHWLAQQVAELPAARRETWQEFLASLDAALIVANDELVQSQQQDRALDVGLINAKLAGVRNPEGLDKFVLSANTGLLAPGRDVETIGTMEASEMVLYSVMRQADYRHDHEAVIDAADWYLKNFSSGLFRDHANAAVIGAHLRLGDDLKAAERFAVRFGDYDEDLKPGQIELVRGLLTVPEFERLASARKKLRE